jgi:SnoaL-like domain
MEATMNEQLDLPEAVAAYFSADRLDSEAVVRCFTREAVVRDENQTHTGIDAIKRWRAEVGSKFVYTSKPLSQTRDGGAIVVTSRLTGNFPGSPVDLRYAFRLERGKIASLEIMK